MKQAVNNNKDFKHHNSFAILRTVAVQKYLYIPRHFLMEFKYHFRDILSRNRCLKVILNARRENFTVPYV